MTVERMASDLTVKIVVSSLKEKRQERAAYSGRFVSAIFVGTPIGSLWNE